MTIVSYAQNYEDVMLLRALGDVEAGFYVDVGAQDPENDSVTRLFYERGWTGINIEPVAYWYERLVEQRPHDINLQVAVSDQPCSMRLYEVPESGLSTLDAEIARHHAEDGRTIRESEIECRTLDEILESSGVQTIHFLKIDCEGGEEYVLRGFSLDRWKPWVLVIEATEPNSQKPAYENWDPLVTAHGYRFVYADGLNRFYVDSKRHELIDAFSLPPNVFDHFIRASEADVRKELGNALASLEKLSDARHLACVETERDFLNKENERRESALVDLRHALQQHERELGSAHVETKNLKEEVVRITEELDQARQRKGEIKIDLANKDEQLKEVHQGLVLKEQELGKASEALSLKEQELGRTSEALSLKEEELSEASEALSLKEQELSEASEALSLKEQELGRASEALSLKEQELSEASEALSLKEQELSETKLKMTLTETRLGEVEADLQQKELRLNETDQELGSKEQQLGEVEQYLILMQQQLRRMDGMLAEAQNDIERLRNEEGRLHHEVARRDKIIARLNSRVNTLVQSLSWKITAPLRMANRALIFIIHKLGFGVRTIVLVPFWLARPALRSVAQINWLRRPFVAILGNQSWIVRRVRTFLFGQPHEPSENSADLEVGEMMPPLTQNARDIRALIEERSKFPRRETMKKEAGEQSEDNS